MKLIVGLGNPGREYAATRHNIGFDVLDAFAAKQGWIPAADEFDRLARTSFEGLTIDGQFSLSSGGTEKVLLLKPMTYMNLSGRSVQAAMAFHKLGPQEVMVVLDDMALPCGKLRIRSSGSNGGHNGLRDIERALSTIQYPRLRVGIDAPPPRVPGRDYVLGKFSPDQRKLLDPAIGRACGALGLWVERGISPAMNQFNGDDEPPAKSTTTKSDVNKEIRTSNP